MNLPAARILHPRDLLQGRAIDEHTSLLTIWCLKEAIAKCDGRGLGIAFDCIRLAVSADGRCLGHYHEMSWHARYVLLPGGVHMAFASEEILSPLCLQIV